jgi:hypothetical protein
LESLELEGNLFTTKGVDQFIKGVGANKTLTDITISEDATDDQLDDLDDILDRNFDLRKKKTSSVSTQSTKPTTPSPSSTNTQKTTTTTYNSSPSVSKGLTVDTKSPVATTPKSNFSDIKSMYSNTGSRTPVTEVKSPLLNVVKTESKSVSSPTVNAYDKLTPSTPTAVKSPSPVSDPVEKVREGESRRRTKSRSGSPSPKVEVITKVVVDEKALEEHRKLEKEREKKKKELEDKLKKLEQDKTKAMKDLPKMKTGDGPPLEFSRDEILKTMEYLAVADETEKSRGRK